MQRFGAELRRRRLAAGLSLAELSRLVHYSKSHLSKVETGVKSAGTDFARRCDAALNADGLLAALVPVPARVCGSVVNSMAGGVWTMTLAPDGGHEFGVLTQPGSLTTSASLMSWHSMAANLGPAGDDDGTVVAFRLIFDHLRGLSQAVGPATLVPVLIAMTNAIRVMARASPPRRTDELFQLASRFAEFTGWMAQEKGDDTAALWWTDHAVELATAGGDHDMVGYAHVRRALVALYRHDALATVALARRTQESACHPRVSALAAQREAQGYAVAGDYSACRRSLDQANRYMRQADEARLSGPVLGTSTVRDPVAFATAWCMHDLGRSREAADILERELTTMPADAKRARARYGARLALALASMQEIEQACAVAEPVLALLPSLDSATIRSDIHQFARTLNRWHTNVTVREIMPTLSLTLRTRVGQ